MSFGFSIGDFVAVFQLVNEIRKRFVDCPDQFKAISVEIKSLSSVLRDVQDVFEVRDLSDEDTKKLHDIIEGCHYVLKDLEKSLGQYQGFNFVSKSIGDKKRSVWRKLKWEPDTIRDFRSRITSNILLLNTFNGSITQRTTQATKDGMDRLNGYQDNHYLRELTDWISPIDYSTQQNDFNRQREKETGLWLLTSDEFGKWSDKSDQTMFCPGIPGAGKTMMVSLVIDHLCCRFKDDAGVGIAYVYYNFGRQDEQKPINILANLLKQLVQWQGFVCDDVKYLYERHKSRRSRPGFDEILKALESILITCSRAFIIIDALDESSSQERERAALIDGMFRLQAQTKTNLFATSRIIPEVSKAFANSIRLEVRATEGDIKRYLNSRLPNLSLCISRHQELREEIENKIIQAVEGMFLLAQLHLDSLIGKTSVKAVKHALYRLPKGSEAINNAYIQAWGRIEDQNEDLAQLAKQVIYWITYAKRPLTSLELQHALTVEHGEPELDTENMPMIEEMVSVCAGLVTVDQDSQIIRLIHHTTQEYFERTGKGLFPHAQTKITSTCLTYLSFDVFAKGYSLSDKELKNRLENNPLLAYAAKNWGYHARGNTELEVEDSILNFLKQDLKLLSSAQVLYLRKSIHGLSSQDFPKLIRGLRVAAFFGLQYTLSQLIGKVNVNHVDSDGRTALHAAAEGGHSSIVEQLLAADATVNVRTLHSQTALLEAAKGGHLDVVKQLLVAGADVNANRDTLLKTVEEGHISVVEELLAKGADVDAVGGTKMGVLGTPLMMAAREGHLEIVEKLLHKSANVNADDGFSMGCGSLRALPAAAFGGHAEVVEMLLAAGAEVNILSSCGTALQAAALEGHMHVVDMLLRAGADINAPAIFMHGDMTALQAAAWRGHFRIVAKLLAAGADINATSDSSTGRGVDSAISAAAENGHLDIIEKLLNEGADINLTPIKSGRTALQAAAKGGHFDIVKTLLNRGADIKISPVDFGQTTLEAAATGGCLKIMEELLNAGAKINIFPTGSVQNALQIAAEKGHMDIVEKLLNEGADVNAPLTKSSRTALQAAAKGGHLIIVKKLLNQGADVNASPPDYGETALQAASKGGYLEITEVLLEKKADVNACAKYGQTALCAAATEGHLNIIDKLLTSGANVNAPPARFAQTALQGAAEYGHLNVVERLFDAGAGINTATAGYGRTALQAAIENDHLDVVNKLLDLGADVNVTSAPLTTTQGHTPLQVAAGKGYMDITEKLLRAGANIDNLTIDTGETALRNAAANGHSNIVEKLLDVGADVNISDSRQTALQAAAASGYVNIVEKLLDHGADVNNFPADFGQTALQAAAANGHLDAVTKLLCAGADFNAPATCRYRGTALQEATERGYRDIAEELRRAGAS